LLVNEKKTGPPISKKKVTGTLKKDADANGKVTQPRKMEGTEGETEEVRKMSEKIWKCDTKT